MRSLIKLATSLLLLAFVLIGISYSMLKAYGTTSGSNPAGRALAGENRPVDGMVNTVEVHGPIDLMLTQGQPASLKVRGEQRSLGNIETIQDGAELHIGTKGMLLNPRHRLRVELVLPDLRELAVNSSGETRVQGFSGDKLELQLHGSGNLDFTGRYRTLAAGIHGSGHLNLNSGNSDHLTLEMVGSGTLTASGSCKDLNAEVTGSGDLDARHLSADKVVLNQRGSGSSQIFARRSADLTLRGSGDVRVLGRPDQRTVDRNGSGDVHWE